MIGLLAAPGQATKGVREALGRSRLPLGFLMLEPDGGVRQFLWNRVASELGLDGVGVRLRYCRDAVVKDGEEKGGGDGHGHGQGVRGEVVLTWRGELLPS